MDKPIEDGSVEAGLTLLNMLWPRELPLTDRDIAFVCGVHHSRVQQMQHEAKKKLRVLAEQDPWLMEAVE